jgi:hypothetical protein
MTGVRTGRRRWRGGGVLLAAAAALALLSLAAGATGRGGDADAAGGPASAAATVFDDASARRRETNWDWPQVTQIVANLRAQHPARPLVVLLGGSSARESTFADDVWSAQIERRGGYPVEAHNLASKHRTFAIDLELVKLLPRDVPTIVYIGINLGQFCAPRRYPTLSLPDPDPSFVPEERNIYSSAHIQTSAEKRGWVRTWLQLRWPRFRENFADNRGVLERVVQACLRRGLHPVLLDLPRDLPLIGHSFDTPVGMYSATCERLSRRYRIPFLHFVGDVRLVDRDFFDIFHVVETGRAKYQRALSDETIRLLGKYGMASQPSPSPSPSESPSPSP